MRASVTKTQCDKDSPLVTEKVPLLKWDVTVIDEQKRPVVGAVVSIRLGFGRTGDNTFHSINGRSVDDRITQTATTNSSGTCSLSIPWTRNVNYYLSVAGQGYEFKFIEEGKDGQFPYSGPLFKEFSWDAEWKASSTVKVYTPEGLAKTNASALAKQQTDETTLTQILLRPADDWTRAAWTPEWAEKAMEINGTFNAPVSDALRAKFTNYQRIVGGLNILKLALTPTSFEQLRKLNTFVQSHPRSNENAVVTADIGGKNVDLTVPFKQAPDLKLYQRCKATGGSTSPECARALASVIPYQNRWNAINLSCLGNPGLVPVANEFNALVKTQILFDAGLIKDDYPLFPGTEISKNDYGPPDARGWICSALVKNEMAKDMARDGFPTDILNSAIGEQLEENWTRITSANFGGKVEKASDQDALLKWFGEKNQVAKGVHQRIGSVKRLKEDEPKESFRPRVEAMLKNTIDPASGRRLDDSLFIFRVKSLYGRDPVKEIVTGDFFLRLDSVHLYDSYDNGSDLTPEDSLSAYITFNGKVRPGQPIPDKRDLAVAAYGWTIGAKEHDDSPSPHLGLVVRRWVMYNIHTGEIYGTSEANGTGKNYGQLFRLDH